MLPRSIDRLIPVLCLLSAASAADLAKPGLTPEDVLNITWAVGPELSPDGKNVVYSVLKWKDGQRVSTKWLSSTSPGAMSRQILAEFQAVRSIRWSPDGTRLAFLAVDAVAGQGPQIFVARADATNPHRMTAMPNGVDDFRWSADSNTIAFTADERVRQVKSHVELFRLTDFNPQLKAFPLGNVKTVQWQSSLDGRTVYGVLITPTNNAAAPPYPTIVNLHSGPHWLWWEGWIGTYLSWGQYLASNGYAVFLPNHRGSIGQGWKFAEAHYLEWGRGDYQDVMDGVDWLVKQGLADGQRLGIGGGSFGGYLTAWSITQTDRFRAAVVEAGWTDLVSSNLTNDAPQPLRLYINGNELERKELYRSRSPMTFVQQCQTPTLLLHGENDRRVPVDQGRMFYRALRLHDVESQMVIYRNEWHGLAKYENQLDALRRTKDWFDKHLR